MVDTLALDRNRIGLSAAIIPAPAAVSSHIQLPIFAIPHQDEALDHIED